MPIFQWGRHWEAFHDVEREVDRLLRNVNLTFQGLRVGRQYPAVNLYELENEYLLTVELPGVRAENLELTIAGGMLTMKGSRDDHHEPSEERYRRQERPRGAWQRSLTLPGRVNEEELSAEFSNGILQIHLRRPPEVQPRQIPVVDGSG